MERTRTVHVPGPSTSTPRGTVYLGTKVEWDVKGNLMHWFKPLVVGRKDWVEPITTTTEDDWYRKGKVYQTERTTEPVRLDFICRLHP